MKAKQSQLPGFNGSSPLQCSWPGSCRAPSPTSSRNCFLFTLLLGIPVLSSTSGPLCCLPPIPPHPPTALWLPPQLLPLWSLLKGGLPISLLGWKLLPALLPIPATHTPFALAPGFLPHLRCSSQQHTCAHRLYACFLSGFPASLECELWETRV